MVEALDHLQPAIPKGAEDRVRPFYILLGFTDVPEPDALVQRLADAGHPVAWETKLADVRCCFVNDPVGNRVELIAA